MGDARQAVEFCLHSPLSELHQSGLGQRRALDRIAVVTGEHDVKAVLPPAKATPALRPIVVTLHPSASSAPTSARPMNPLAPAMTTRLFFTSDLIF
jgi:hypothetical protein